MAAKSLVKVPVTLVMEKHMARHRQWVYPRWRAVGVVAADRDAGRDREIRCRSIHQDRNGSVQFLWSGLCLEFHRGAAESYWHNLVGSRPALFVACRADADGEMRPCTVSADYDEASAYMEADDTVYAVPIPPEIHRQLEEYVLEHYWPTAPHRRRRTAWSDGVGNVHR
jgi:hypothetical protein